MTEDTLWTGIPGDYTDPNAPEALAEVRKLVDNGKYSKATAAAAKLTGDPSEAGYLIRVFECNLHVPFCFHFLLMYGCLQSYHLLVILAACKCHLELRVLT